MTNLSSEWHPTRNEISFDSLKPGSHKVVWWLGECGHEWETKFYSRIILGSSCPYCSNNRVLSGFNDLFTRKPSLSSFWCETNDVSLSEVLATSRTVFHWKCNVGHVWEASAVQMFKRKNVCLSCFESEKVALSSGKLRTKTSRSWSMSDFPELLNSFASDLNAATPHQVNSTMLVWWRCSLGHIWQSPSHRRIVKGKIVHNCPSCFSLKKKANSLRAVHPKLADEWHPDLNGNVSPEDVTFGSGRKVWWVCIQDSSHVWESAVSTRSQGSGCPFCAGQRTIPGVNDLKSKFPDIFNELHPSKNLTIEPSSLSFGSQKTVWWLCDKGHEWESKPCYRTGLGQGCPTCAYSKGTSKMELEVHNWLANEGVTIHTSVRSVLKGKEIDVYLPDHKIGIEMNGLYWHDEHHKPKSYHHDKWLTAKEMGVQLIQIWEDDWILRKDQVKKLILHKIGKSPQKRVYARKTSVVEISYRKASDFLYESHIQGPSTGYKYYALQTSDGLLQSVMVVTRTNSPNAYMISRYASTSHVIGGFTKLLAAMEQDLSPEKVTTFSDHTVSDGGLYEKNGFIVDQELSPDYMYVVAGERKHKFGYRLKRFRNDPTLKFEEGLTEKQLAALNNIPRIWDAGKTKWVKHYD